MSETTSSENPAGAATALAEPPQPPGTPPGSAASGAPEPGGRRAGVIAAIVLGVLALALLAVVAYLIVGSRPKASAPSAQTIAAYESAMRKAGVQAAYPGKPVALTDVTPSGSHEFSATFSAAEVVALLNTHPFESDSAGVRISLRNVSISIPAAGTARLAANVTANGGTYTGTVTIPLEFAEGRVDSTGATALDVEGIPGNDAQKSQVTSALLGYFNAYLAAAPGLEIESASIGADGVTVKGTAPDSLAFP